MEINEARKALIALSRIKKINEPNPKCPSQCTNAKKATLSIANQEKDIDPTKYVIICSECNGSIWRINQKK